MDELRVYYKSKDRIDSKFDKEIENIAEKHGLKRWASGFNYEDKERDVCFKGEEK